MREWFENLDPNKKRRMIIAFIAAVIVACAVAVSVLSRKETYRGLDTTTEVDVFLPKKKDTTLEGLAGQMLSLEKRMQELERYVRAMEPNLKELVNTRISSLAEERVTETETKLKSIEQKLDILATEIKMLKEQRPGGVPPTVKTPPGLKPSSGVAKAEGGEGFGEVEEEEVAVGNLRVVGEEEAEEGEEGVEEKAEKEMPPSAVAGAGGYGGVTERDLREREATAQAREVYLPAGSIIQGVLLSGLDAPTGKGAVKNPVPALVRVKHDAILPNRFRLNVRECFMIVSGYGVLSSERANLRTERMSCVLRDGGVVETQINGWVIGEDGKAGMRGRLVSKQGRIIARTILAGVLSGLAKSFQPTSVPVLDITPGETTEFQFPSPQGVLAGAFLGGTGSALEKVADYYLQMADEMFPVIEVDAGRRITVVLVTGSRLKL